MNIGMIDIPTAINDSSSLADRVGLKTPKATLNMTHKTTCIPNNNQFQVDKANGSAAMAKARP